MKQKKIFTSETLSSEAQLTLNGCGFSVTFCLFWNLEGMDTKNDETITPKLQCCLPVYLTIKLVKRGSNEL